MNDSTFDLSEVLKLAADLGEVPGNAGPLLNSAVQLTAVKVKKAAAKTVGSRRKSWSVAAGSIDYDVKADPGAVSTLTAEVGYNKSKRAGPLGNLIEFGAPGAPNGLLAPHNDLANALHENEADFQKGLEIALKDAERRAGL